jgi:ATP-binding cassette subfamily C (CFTR/MRP) protein 1
MSQAAPTLPGTARFNLDPLGLADDSAVLIALEKVGIHIKLTLQGGLHAQLSDVNLSAGEQQLFRFVAVLLRPANTLFPYEVTSSLDVDTEEL